MGFRLGDSFSFIANPGNFWGTNNLIGGAINDITGQSSSARQQYKNNLALQKNSQDFAKWQMENAHQTEVQDLENAGLNPVLSAGGNGASATPSANSTGAGTPGMDPISMAGVIMNMINSAKMTKATVEKTEAETDNIKTNTQWTPELNQSLIRLQHAQTAREKTTAELQVAEKLAVEFNNKMREMDVDKRSSDYVREKMIYQKQMQRALILAGYGNENWDLIWSKFGERIKQLSPLADWQPHMNSSSYNYSPVSVNY